MCELRYDKQIDLKNVNLKKLKVRDLKKILNDWDETVSADDGGDDKIFSGMGKLLFYWN